MEWVSLMQHEAIIWTDPVSTRPVCSNGLFYGWNDVNLDNHDLNDLRYFSHVVEHGGFSAAERALGISKSRLSRRLSDLEAALGVRLLQRSTRKLALTEAGALFHRHCQAMLGEARAALDAVRQLGSTPRGTVRVSVPMTVSQTMLSHLMPEFLRRYPEVKVAIQVTNRVIDLFEDDVDVALRVRSEPHASSNIVVRPLWRSEQMLVGSPSLLDTNNPPMRPADLARYATLSVPSADGRYMFKLTAPDGTRHDYEHEPRLVTADLLMIHQAVLAGVGIAVLPNNIYQAAMNAGKLSPVMPGWTLSPPQLYAVFLSRQGLLPAVRAFIDFLVERIDSGAGVPQNCPA